MGVGEREGRVYSRKCVYDGVPQQRLDCRCDGSIRTSLLGSVLACACPFVLLTVIVRRLIGAVVVRLRLASVGGRPLLRWSFLLMPAGAKRRTRLSSCAPRAPCLCLGRGPVTALDEILTDMDGGGNCTSLRMFRLLQGDVGSGKTAVAFLAMLKAAGQGSQSCMLAPTEVLTVQHLQVIRACFSMNFCQFYCFAFFFEWFVRPV